MGSGIDSYLHKKFKKQLSFEPKPPQNHDKENRVLEERKEKSAPERVVPPPATIVSPDPVTQLKLDESVPNQSTNQNIIYAVTSNLKSSISLEKPTNNLVSTSCISYSNFEEPNVGTEPNSVYLSSMSDSAYSKHTYVTKTDDISHVNLPDHSQVKEEEIQAPPDRSSTGKYICTYCNLACSKPSVLQKHIRAHTNERPYPCNSCGFSFKTRSNLYKHCRSRTHANRVMGNKAQELTDNPQSQKPVNVTSNDFKNDKPYKPRFHTFDVSNSVSKENIEDEQKEEVQYISASSELLSHHINEIIYKNSSIVNTNDGNLIKKRPADLILDTVNNNEYLHRPGSNGSTDLRSNSTDEPLNLTKNRKRCLSEVAEPVPKSLIKELLLKNLSADNNRQCQYCKMIFQTVTEFDLHKLRNCKGKGVKYSRSSSVNVASILTQNKNAFDNIPHLQNTTFPLNSPGPFLGKTRLVDSDKTKSFSFEDGLRHTETTTSYYPFEKKMSAIKLFGGEVKITHTSGESKSFKIDNKEETYENDKKYNDFGGKMSENRVIKSGLGSGGTVLSTNKTNYNKQDMKNFQDVIRVYENILISPSIDMRKNHTNFDRKPEPEMNQIAFNNMFRQEEPIPSPRINNNEYSPSYVYPNIMDFSQNAVKLLTPNLKQPKQFLFNNVSPKPQEMEVDSPRILSQDQISSQLQKIYVSNRQMVSPMNLMVQGKVVRYVPGIPGPVVAEEPVNLLQVPSPVAAPSRISPGAVHSSRMSPVVNSSRISPVVNSSRISPVVSSRISPEISRISPETLNLRPSPILDNRIQNKSPEIQRTKIIVTQEPEGSKLKLNTLEIRTELPNKLAEMKSPTTRVSEFKSPVKTVDLKSPLSINISETKKFARPNSLALKPTTASLKQHHGLTPTMFNQILISPDTPRVDKKYAQHFLHGNYFSYLGLKSSTKPVYCTLNKTQPSYVPHFKKLSMYSEWRQQDTRTDRLFVSAYDSRQKSERYTMSGKSQASMIIHSSYKFIVSEQQSGKSEKDDPCKSSQILGGFECNDDYTYIRGRGRGKYVCDQCGIRCKKPSMLKKHIRTHSNDRPYTCSHCNFSFKTKGNLTKHMKSKVHTKNYAASGSSGSSTQQSGTQSSDSDTDDSGMDSSDESTRNQEHEAAYGLLSLSQKTSPSTTTGDPVIHTSGLNRSCSPVASNNEVLMTTEELVHVSKTSYAKNKILNERLFSAPKTLNDFTVEVPTSETQNTLQFLGKSSVNRPLTYPYTSVLTSLEAEPKVSRQSDSESNSSRSKTSTMDVTEIRNEPKCIKQFHVIQKYINQDKSPKKEIVITPEQKTLEQSFQDKVVIEKKQYEPRNNKYWLKMQLVEKDDIMVPVPASFPNPAIPTPTIKINDVAITSANSPESRKRKFPSPDIATCEEYAMDLSKPIRKPENRCPPSGVNYNPPEPHLSEKSPKNYESSDENYNEENYNNMIKNNGKILLLTPQKEERTVQMNYVVENNQDEGNLNNYEYDNSAMETLADIATKQVKLEKNVLAKSVASEYLKLTAKNEYPQDANRDVIKKGVNDLVKPEGNKSCTICSKSFSKPSQLRLHMNIHYLERPFRCDTCSVSFRTKGHLQKHERSASHHNKLSSSPALSSSEPRPFKCSDCNIAFRIHGHLAKHLRSKMHIMKLECLAKIPFGLYAELERCNILLTEINTCDGDQCLESLKVLASKVFMNDPKKLNQLGEPIEHIDTDP